MKKYISINLNYIREQNRLSQKDMAAKFDITQTTLSNYETGKNEPTMSFLINFCNEFNLTIDNLVKYDLSRFKNKALTEVKEEPETYKVSKDETRLYNQLIDAKEAQIESLNSRIEELKKQINIYEVLLNQNGIL